MYEKIVEILIYVLNEVRRTNKPLGEIDVSVLQKKGYTEAEITTAFSWLFDRLRSMPEPGRLPESNPSESFRVLHAAEQYVISADAFGYLLQLRELGLMTASQLEMVIDRAMMSGFEHLSVADIQDVVASVLFETDGSRGKMIMDANDTIQ